MSKDYFVHESSIVEEGATIGPGTKIWGNSQVFSGAEIGKDCTIARHVDIGPKVSVGDKCKIQNNVSLFTGVTIEDRVFIGPSAVFTNISTPRAFVDRKAIFKPTLVKEGASIGANATILCGNTIGRYALIGAGAVVTKSVPDYALVYGNPARQQGWVCECGEVLTNQISTQQETRLTCKGCDAEYTQNKNKFVPVRKTL